MALDYRDATYAKEKPQDKLVREGITSPRWWELPHDEMASSVVAHAESMKNNSGDRMAAMVRWARMYENCDLQTLAGREFAVAIVRQLVNGVGQMTFNVSAACVDTLAAKIAKNKPRPNFLTSGGSWDNQMKARNLDKFMRGLFYETRVYDKAQHVFVDGCEFGTGFLYVYPADDKRLECERVMPGEIFVDDLDGQYGSPRQLMRVKYVSREVLTSMFPKKAMEIANAGKKMRPESASASTLADVVENTVEVWEAWHLPSSKKARDGKYAMVIDGCVLEECEWKVPRFPFVPFRYKRRTSGFWGKGVVETVANIQVEMNRLVRSISEQLRRKGRGRIFVQMGSKVNPAHMTNGIGDIVFYNGQPPHVDNGNAIAPEEFAQIDRLYQRAFQEVGVSELSAAARKPSGLDAAVALREYSDIESERFALVHQAWEQFFLDYAALCLDLIKTQYGWEGYKMKLPSKRYVIEVDWADIDLDADSYVMQMFPTSSLPQTPAARYAKVKEMMADGFIDKAVAQRLLDFPDIEAESNLGNAIIDDVDATISAILDAKEPELLPLEPYQNLDMMIQRATAAYLYARHHDCPDDRLEMLRNLINNASATKAQLMAPPEPQMPPGPPMGAAPPPMPGAPMGASVGGNINIDASAPPMPTVPPVVA